MDATWVVGVLCVCVMVFWKRLRVITIKGLPPGSLGLPIVGQTLQFIRPSSTQQLEPFLQQNRKRYGPVFRASLYGNWTIVSTDVDVNKFVLQNEGRLFKGYWPKSFYKLFGRYSIGMVTGDQHKLYRSLIVNFLGTGKSKMSLMIPTVESVALSIMQDWKHDSPINILQASQNYIFGVLCKKILSLNQIDAHQVHELYKDYEAGLFAFPLELPGTKYSKALQARVKMVEIFQRIIEERRKNPERNYNDMLDYFLSQKIEGLSDEVIHDNLTIMFFAGEDTTAKTLTALISILKQFPHIHEEVLNEQNEILKLKGKGEGLNMDDYLKMSFTQYVISEALRTVNPSLGLFRIALQDVEIKGNYKIPKGWKVYVSQSSANLDPNPFPNPTKFDPLRWKNMDTSSSSCFMPFGKGIRQCPGYELARLEMAIFLHHFLLNFDWEVIKGGKMVHDPMVSYPEGLHVRLKSNQGRKNGTRPNGGIP